jgi:hypothetical protein
MQTSMRMKQAVIGGGIVHRSKQASNRAGASMAMQVTGSMA